MRWHRRAKLSQRRVKAVKTQRRVHSLSIRCHADQSHAIEREIMLIQQKPALQINPLSDKSMAK
jgi:hypothetical protein